MNLKLPLLLLLLLVLVSTYIFVQTSHHLQHAVLSSASPHVAQAYAIASPSATRTSTQYATAPKTVSIPKIGLIANIVALGLNDQKDMDVPDNFVDVGWYDLGYKPGQLGSAVLDGHYDDFHGQPAVFYYLDTLTKGDKIIVTDQTGKQLTYIVTDNEVYPVDGLPLQQIFASNDAARLNIITCHGQYENTIQTYNQRTVIYSVLERSATSS